MNPLPAEIVVDQSHGHGVLILRPSLRAAVQVERLHDGFAPLLARLRALHLATIHSVIRAAASDRQAADAFLARAAALPLKEFFAATVPPCLALVAALVPAADEKPQKTQPKGKPMTWAEYHGRLYAIATGWLQWPPATAWAATPAEIEAAYRGHLDMLKAIHGSADEQDDTPDALTDDEISQLVATGQPDPTFNRAGLHRLKSATRLARWPVTPVSPTPMFRTPSAPSMRRISLPPSPVPALSSR